MEHIKHLSLGWLVMAAALLFAGCSSEDGVMEEQTPQQPQQTAATIHVTVGAGITDGEATTRSTVDYTGGTRTLQFTTGDKLYVCGKASRSSYASGYEYYGYVLAGMLALDAIDPDDPTKATFSGDLSVYEALVDGDYDDGTGDWNVIYGVTYPDANRLDYLPYFISSDDPLSSCDYVRATLIHEGTESQVTIDDYKDISLPTYDCAATVEELMTTGLIVTGNYYAGTKSFALEKDRNQPIVNCTIAGLTAWMNYKVDYIYGATAAMDGGTKTLYSDVYPEEGGTLTFAFIAETGDKFHGIRLTNTWGDVYDVMEDVSLGQKSFTSKVYNATRTAVHVPQTIDLSTSSYSITARNGDVLTGTMSNGDYVRILDGATVTLRGVNISNTFTPIYCHANAVIVLEGDNTLTANNTGIMTWANYREGDAVPTLEIKGTGSLNVTAVGSSHSAAIGSPNYRNSSQAVSCGNITISGGTVTATGGSYAAAIGCGPCGKCGAITISGGTVTATAGEFAAAIGCGRIGSCGAITISGGTVTASNNSSEYAAIGGKMSGDGSDGSDCTSITITDGITSVAMTNSKTDNSLSSFAYAANINLDGFTLTAQQAKTPVSTVFLYGLLSSYNGITKTWTLTNPSN